MPLILAKFVSRLFKCGPADTDARITNWLLTGHTKERTGDLAQALALFRKVLDVAPANAEARLRLGAVLAKSGDLDQARVNLQRAIALSPGSSEAHAVLGNVRMLQHDHADALANYERAIELDPVSALARVNLGLLLKTLGRREDARRAFETAYRIAPGVPGLLKNLTLVYIELEQYAQAHALLDPLLDAAPDNGEALRCKGFVLQKQHCAQAALAFYERACAVGEPDAELLNNLGIVKQDLGRIDEAIDCYDRAIALEPGFELALWHRSLALLLKHDFARGWTDYDSRLISADRQRRDRVFPRWDGANSRPRTVLAYAEQGLGDEIMFASCVPDLVAAAGRCIIECSPKLAPLFARSFPDAIVYASAGNGCPPAGLAIDSEIPLGSLPAHFRRSRAAFPEHRGYLRADPCRRTQWRARLAALGPGRKIGVAWHGGTQRSRMTLRSLTLGQLDPVLATPGVHFVNLQYNDSSIELAQYEALTGRRLTDWPELREDYEDTAAVVAELDLVISVCTAVIHLGGALGQPVWVLAPHSPEWRYGIAGATMPWYPSVHIFRQPHYGAWEPVIERVAQRLGDLASSSGKPINRHGEPTE